MSRLDAPGRIRWAGLAAVAGGVIAIVLTVPFSIAFALAYPEEPGPPDYLTSLAPELGSLLTFAAPNPVYELYGRAFDLVYLLFLPAVFAVHRLHHDVADASEVRAFRILAAGLVIAFVGVAGDYWLNGLGFPVEVLGLLVMIVGTTLFGLATLRGSVLPRWSALLMVAGGLPGAVAGSVLTGHVPTGPTLFFAVAWLAVGIALLCGAGARRSNAMLA